MSNACPKLKLPKLHGIGKKILNFSYYFSLFCAVNPKFIAIINKGSGGPFLVIPVNKVF